MIGLWYFDENSLPRPNLANPYNLEPRFVPDPLFSPVWDSGLNRWTVFDGKRLNLEIGNFLNFRQDEIIRGFSVVLDFRLMSPPGSLVMSTLATYVLIGTIISDIEIGILFRGSDRRIQFAYRKTNGAWFQTTAVNSLSINADTIWVINFTRSIADPTQLGFTFSVVSGQTYTNGSNSLSSNIHFFILLADFFHLNLVVSLADVKVDPLKSSENVSVSFGEQTNTGTNFYFAVNRVLLFKGTVEMMKI